MQAEIKGYHSPDVDPLETYIPEIEDNFGFLLQVMVGEKNKEGADTFDIMVCTPKWLTANHSKDEFVFGRHYLFVWEYNYERLVEKLKGFVNSIKDDSWDGIAEKINRVGRWEFEDYKEYEG